jgi:hypothetical protein
MPGSPTTPGHTDTRAIAPICIAFHTRNCVGSRKSSFAARWLAYDHLLLDRLPAHSELALFSEQTLRCPQQDRIWVSNSGTPHVTR